jgi:hypothetical protein
MTAYLAGALDLAGQHKDLLAYLHSWVVVAGIGVAAVVVICLLRGPVMTDKVLGTFGALASKFGPKIFYAAVGVLIVGILIGQIALIIIGGGVAGSLLVGLLAWHY